MSINQPLQFCPSTDAMLYALSLITHCREFRPHSPELSNTQSSTTKHLKLLNLLSLLLVTKGKGDVAAISLYLRTERPELYYAKNRPCTADEKRYIDVLFKIATSTNSAPPFKQYHIAACVVQSCRPKINSRIRRLCVRLGDLVTQNYSITVGACKSDTGTGNYIRDKIGSDLFLPHESLESFLQTWFTRLLTMDYKTMETGGIVQLFMISYSIGNSPAIGAILDKTLINRLRKVGDYYAAPRALTTAMSQLTKSQLQRISFIEIIPEQPRALLLSANYLTTINKWARYSGNIPITVDQLINAFPNATNPPSPDSEALTSVTSSVHCECTLIMAHLSFSFDRIVCEIGVSKSCCWMCREYIRIVERLYPTRKIQVSSCHGKIVAGWRLPEGASADVKRAVQKRVHDEVDEVLDRGARRKKPDSMPRGTGSEIGETPEDVATINKLMDDGGGVWVREK